jgi:TetR/AcrR family fatty acid metabolism transcriptional regulator
MKRQTDKYHRILTAAIKVFAEQGFNQATVAQIARAAGVADGTIYLYFKNKDDILVQFYSNKAQQVFDRFRQAVNQADSALAKLHNLIRIHLEEFSKDPHMAIAYQIETRQQRVFTQQHIREMATMYRDIISEIIGLGQQEGTIRSNLPMGLVKRMINGTVDEVINAWIHKGAEADLVGMAEPLVDLFINGIGAAADTGRVSSPALSD